MKIIEPIILKGTREFLPKDMAKRNFVMNKIAKIFQRFGYDNIETPIINPAETILGKYGEEGDRLTYSFKDNGDRLIALPYDLTVPFARLVAANWQNLPMPFKRYQIQRVWRAEKPQKGRLREFYQCDVDLIGTRSLIAEAEIAKIITTVFKELGFKNFVTKFNSRRLLNSILESFEVKEPMKAIQIIDKLAKIGEAAVLELLEKENIKNSQKILDLLKPEKSNSETLKKLSNYDISEIQELLDICKNFQIAEKYLQFDPTLARGLDYYTGVSYEVYSDEADFGALCAGGRYDNLCGMFCNQDFSGVGVAFGFERIILGLEKMGKLEDVKLSSKVLVTIFDENSVKESIDLYSQLTDALINCEIYFEPAKLSKQFKYADKKEIPFVVIQGPEEKEKNEVTIKSMKTGKQKSIPQDQLIFYLKGYYES